MQLWYIWHMADFGLKIIFEYIKEYAPRNWKKALAMLLCLCVGAIVFYVLLVAFGLIVNKLEELLVELAIFAIVVLGIARLSRQIIKLPRLPANIKKLVFFIEGWFFGSPQGYFNYGLECLSIKDYNEAAKWFKKAAQRGYAKAQINLGIMHAKGEGVTQDYKKAVKWFKKAAEQELAPAQYNLAGMYDKGEGGDTGS